MSNTIKYFVKNKELSFGEAKEGEPIHRLIIGDNYDALNNLLIQFKRDIDTIYIDPPYGKDSMGEFAKTNYNNSITRDNLLSMLYFRLQIAKQLLSESTLYSASASVFLFTHTCLRQDLLRQIKGSSFRWGQVFILPST